MSQFVDDVPVIVGEPVVDWIVDRMVSHGKLLACVGVHKITLLFVYSCVLFFSDLFQQRLFKLVLLIALSGFDLIKKRILLLVGGLMVASSEHEIEVVETIGLSGDFERTISLRVDILNISGLQSFVYLLGILNIKIYTFLVGFSYVLLFVRYD